MSQVAVQTKMFCTAFLTAIPINFLAVTSAREARVHNCLGQGGVTVYPTHMQNSQICTRLSAYLPLDSNNFILAHIIISQLTSLSSHVVRSQRRLHVQNSTIHLDV